MSIARKIKPYSLLFVLFGPETALPLRIRTLPPFLAGIPQGPKKLEESSDVPLYLPYQSRYPSGTPLASRPQRSGVAIPLRFVQQLLATLLPELEIHHLVHPGYSYLCMVRSGALSVTLPTPQPDAELRHISVDPHHPVIG